MATVPDTGRWESLRSERTQWAVIGGLLVAVFLARAAIPDATTIGVSFLYLVPVLLAAFWLDARQAVLVGLFGAALYALGAPFGPEPFVPAAVVLRMALFCGIGYVVASLVERQRRLVLEVARQSAQIAELRVIREALVPPRPPELAGMDLASRYVPAEHDVAGDFFMVALGPGGTTILVIGDAMGHGVEPARRTAFVRASLSTFIPFTAEPDRLLQMANQALYERADESGAFVTAACVAIGPDRRSMSWALAGHHPPMWLDWGSELEGAHGGIPLGLEPDLGCRTSSAELPPGSGVLLFTDGVLEARAPGGADSAEDGTFGSRRLSRQLMDLRGASPDAVVDEVRSAAESFSGGRLADDLCLLAVRTGVDDLGSARAPAAPVGARAHRAAG